MTMAYASAASLCSIPMSRCARRMCAVELTGRYSVSPSTRPRMSACHQFISYPRLTATRSPRSGARDRALRSEDSASRLNSLAFRRFAQRRLRALLPGLHIGFEHLDRLGELHVFRLAGFGPDDHVGNGAVEFHIFAGADHEP